MNPQLTIAMNHGALGGGEVMGLAIAEAARELGRAVLIVAPQQPGDVLRAASERGFPAIAIKAKSTADYLKKLRAWDKKHRTGLLWCNGLRPALATAGHPQRVVHLHQQPTGKQIGAAQLAMAGALRTVVPSHWMLSAAPGATVLWNWCAEPTPAPRADRLQRRPIRLGFLGRLSTDKGVDVLCQAVEKLDEASPGQYRLLLAGNSLFVADDNAVKIRREVERLNRFVVHTGWLDRDQFFTSTDLAVFASQSPESFGLVAAEAMAAKVPFVISDAGALPEVAGEGYRFIAKAGDPNSLARTIERACAADWQAQLESSYARWQQHFSPEAGRRRLARILQEIDPAQSSAPAGLSIVLAHDYLTQRGGAERVAAVLAKGYPQAPIITSLYETAKTYPEFRDHRVVASPLNRFGVLRRHFRFALPLYGSAFEWAPVPDETAVVICSTTGFAHGVGCGPQTRKLVYCHSPARFLYLVDDYLGGPWWSTPLGWGLMAMRPGLIWWDKRAARSADRYLCNSTVVAERIKQIYGIEATVVPPPSALSPTDPQTPIDDLPPGFFLLVSRLLPYKNVHVVLDAFARLPEQRLLIVGHGPLGETLRAGAPANAEFREDLDDAQLRWAYANCTALIAPSKEDFGLTPVEGFGFGKPTLALRAGGYLDTVVPGRTGYFFDQATAEAVVNAVHQVLESPLPIAPIIADAERFTPARFIAEIQRHVNELLDSQRDLDRR